MRALNARLAMNWKNLDPRYLPFADVATDAVPLSRLLRLSLFQVSVGMAMVLLGGTLNRVMVVELGVDTWLVALMVALPIVFAPLRVLLGFKSDTHRSFLGWRRVPYIWLGSMLQFGGFAIMPFALLILSGDGGPIIVGQIAAAAAFLLVGAGLHTVQTAGLALAADLVTEDSRPRVVALLYVMLLVGMLVSSVAFGGLLEDFSQLRLIQVIQGAAVVTLVLNLIALWKQEARNPELTRPDIARPSLRQVWRGMARGGEHGRLLVAVGLGTAAFSMQDILLEPYGGEILGLSVSATTVLTALWAGGAILGFAVAARVLNRGGNPFRLAATGVLAGIFAFACVIFAAPIESATLFRAGAVLIGFGGGLFAVGTLTAALNQASGVYTGLAVGAWGAVHATAMGLSIALGGVLRDLFSGLSEAGHLGPALTGPTVGYGSVYLIEIGLLFATLVAIGPLVRSIETAQRSFPSRGFGLADFPG